MKNKIFTLITVLALGSIFVACSSGSDSTVVEVIEDITLSAGDSTTCTNVTAFTVTPTDDPDVVFSTDTSSGDTTITIETSSTGTVLIQNCTVK